MNAKLTIDNVTIDTKQFARGLFERVAREELTNTMARLQKATEQGRDAHGQALKRYSRSYVEAIQKGEVPGKVNTETTLRVTNDMMNSMQVKPVQNGAELFFSGNHQRVSRQRSSKTASGARRKVNRGSSSRISNTGLAQALIDKGFTGWFEYGEDDLRRIDARMQKELQAALDGAIVVKNA